MAKKKTAQPEYVEQPSIVVKGARTHNLKGIDCTIPAQRMTVVTGLSGSGKSSFAFDTLYAEGQRRYVESLSTYARQFIARMPRPDVDHIENIPPAIALEQKNSVRNARSTIGTATEINDYLRLVYAKAGSIVCPTTKEKVRRDAPEAAMKRTVEVFAGKPVYVVAPIRLERPELLDATLRELQRQGYTRLLVGGELREIDQPDFKSEGLGDRLFVVIDRMAVKAEERSRLTEAIEVAYRIAGGRCIVRSREGVERLFSEELRCHSCPGNCGNAFREPSPQLLNFSSPLGACVTCQGFGRVTGIDWEKVIPNPALSLNEGAIAPFSGESGRECLKDLRREAKKIGVRMDVPWKGLSEREQNLVKQGEGGWYGIAGFFGYLEEHRYKVQSRVMIARYRGYTDCPECGGTRLRREALAIQLGGKNIGDVCALSVKDAAAWFAGVELSKEEQAIAERPLQEVRARLGYLLEVGLGYLTLARQTRTLSGGESQRINLSTSLGSALTETLYVLDEPTVGLHPRDTGRLIGVLHRLRELGNTVVVVEHDPDVWLASDYLIDIGPEAGERGGQVVWAGAVGDIAKAPPESKSAPYLLNGSRKESRGKAKPATLFGRRQPTGWITIRGASENNLKHVDVRVPLGVLCCVTGVSGSGKSSLIHKCLFDYYQRTVKGIANVEPGRVQGLEGVNQVDDILLIDQGGIGRSTRSNPATYLKAYDQIRALLASTPEAQTLGLTQRDFSFNVEGGRCEACEGTGMQTIDMHFLADVQVLCDVCEGNRFQDRVLQATWKGLTVNRILDLTINEALEFFAEYPRIRAGLDPMAAVGLGYLRLGQSTATLSGGEAQRLKLAAHIAEAGERRNLLLLFDEPTTGLHPADLEVLHNVFEQLLEKGFSLVVIEHNLQLIRQADWLIDMGPEGGDEGGQLVAEGTPEQVAANPQSLTGKFLAKMGQKAK